MSANIKIGIAVGLAVIVLGVSAFLLFRSSDDTETAVETEEVATAAPEPTPTPTLAEQLSDRLKDVTLATSDATIRELVGVLSTRPELAKWLANEDLVRRFTATVENIASGRSPRNHLGFLAPKKGFQVTESGDELHIDPKSFDRYDHIADIIASIDADQAVALYRELSPLIREAYREIAPPGARFEDRLVAAIDHLLAAPKPPRKASVERKVVTYTYAEERLEQLSDAQKHLLRMGPENAQKIADKLRELKIVLQAPAQSTPVEQPDADAQ